MKRILPIISMLVLLASCSREQNYILDRHESGFLTMEDAQSFFDTSLQKFKTKGLSEDSLLVNFFYRGAYEPIWDSAEESHSSTTSWMDIPVDDNGDFVYYAAAYDSHGFYWTKSYHSITVMKDRATGTMVFYNHFFVPGRDMVDKYGIEDFDNELFHSYLTNEDKDGFEGMEFFTNMKGEVVVFNRYFSGELYEHVYIHDGRSDTCDYMKWALNCYLGKMYRFPKETLQHSNTKAAGNNAVFARCPECNCTELIQLSSGGYLCPDCGWMYGGSLDGGYVEGSWPSGDDDPEEPYTPVPDEEPGNGNSGGGHHSGGGGVDSSHHFPGFIFDESAYQYIKPTLEIINSDCAGELLINTLSNTPISFVKVNNMMDLAHFVPARKNRTENGETHTIPKHRIEYNVTRVIDCSVLFEELVHGIQVINGNYSSDNKLNCEIEAKMAAFIYMSTNHKSDLFMDTESYYSNSWNGTFRRYMDDPSDSNYRGMISFIQSNGNYQDSTYVDNPNCHIMVNIYDLFEGCNMYLTDRPQIYSITH